MKKTKIICTMGPNTSDRELLKKLMENGMDIARFNFSHGDYEEHLERIELIKSVRDECNLPIAMLLDTKGPEIRTGLLKDDKKVYLKDGAEYVLTIKDVIGDDTIGHVTYPGLPGDLEVGNKILIDDGLIELEVKSLTDTDITCTVINGGELGMRKGINVPNVDINLPSLTEKDKSDIMFGVEQGFDFIAVSFVRNAECVREIKQLLNENGVYIPLISKIENAQGVNNIDEILKESDGIMVARGDLGVEIPVEQVPYVQKMIIKKCNDSMKPVITATQLLDSMIRNPRPTRAEVTDVANAIYDGTDVVMLSGETAVGKYPLESLKMMAHIAVTTEEHLDYEQLLKDNRHYRQGGISGAVGYASVSTALNLNAKAIIIPTLSGVTAREVSKFKPKAIILGTSPERKVLRKMQIYWGVKPLHAPRESSTDEIMNASLTAAKESGEIRKGDVVVMTAGVATSSGQGGVTNLMKIEKI